MSLKANSLDCVKGWTRASCVAFALLAAADMDASDAQHCAMLEPLHNVLDRSWLVPMHETWFLLVFACESDIISTAKLVVHLSLTEL